MIRNLKTLGLAIVAVLAMSAVVASAASASEFTASSYSGAGATATASSAKGNDDFKTEAGSVECKGHFHVGPLKGASASVTVEATYSECVAFGFLNSTVHMNGCDYTFFTNGNVDLTCEAGEGPVTITAGTCEVQIHGQDNLGKVDLSSDGSDVVAQATVGNIAYTVTKDGFGCPFGGTGTKGGATYTQNNPVTVTGNGGRTVSIS